MKAPEVCEGCGACCWEQQVELTETDLLRVPAGLWHYEPDCENPLRMVPAMRQNRGTQRCVALGADFRCEIYELRPTPCRTFEHGSWGCRKCVERHGPHAEPELIQVLHFVASARPASGAPAVAAPSPRLQRRRGIAESKRRRRQA